MQAPSGVPPTSPTVSTLHEALLVKWAFASVTADSRSELGPAGTDARAARITLHPVESADPNHDPACTGTEADGTRLFCGVSQPGGFAAVARPLGPTAVPRPGSGLQDGAGGDEAGLDVAPQGDQELPRQGHDRDPPDPALGGPDPGREPLAQGALRLEAHPQPGELDHHPADPRVAGLAHALLAAGVAARERARHQAGVGRHAAPVRERTVEELGAQALEAQQRRRFARNLC